MFVDDKIVFLKAGNGGHGCMSFKRGKYRPKEGPDGGDGGKGGHIILECDINLTDLSPFRFQPHRKAGNGQPGQGSRKSGKNGNDCIIKMPSGTIVFDEETGLQVTELTKHGQSVTLITGGKGGLGNTHFKSSTNQAPRKTTDGVIVEEKSFKLVLKVISDIGLVGFPNAGKSSLTRLLTRAQPKTAPYPFTTKVPNIGVIDYPDEYARLFLADIPGLIKGAHQNKGLGHRFLRHIERCRLLLIVLDMAGKDDRNPLNDYQNLLEELKRYNPTLLKKKTLLAANKMDLPEAQENLNRLQKKFNLFIQPISCQNESGIKELKLNLLKTFQSATPLAIPHTNIGQV